MTSTIEGADRKRRCKWSSTAPEFLHYHDSEWGFPVDDDYRLFEKLCLEGFQSGLSWRTILVKRESFRAAFHHFNFNKIASFIEHDVAKLLQNEGLIRHRGKIEAVINNAKRAQEIVTETGSLAAFLWRYAPALSNTFKPQNRSTSEDSIMLAKQLKKAGWKFIGPTTTYAFMQAMGLINDHAEDCVIRAKVEKVRNNFQRPI